MLSRAWSVACARERREGQERGAGGLAAKSRREEKGCFVGRAVCFISKKQCLEKKAPKKAPSLVSRPSLVSDWGFSRLGFLCGFVYGLRESTTIDKNMTLIKLENSKHCTPAVDCAVPHDRGGFGRVRLPPHTQTTPARQREHPTDQRSQWRKDAV